MSTGSAPDGDDPQALYDAAALSPYAAALLTAGGMRADMADDAASVLVEADVLGYPTHGLSFLPAYLDRLANGAMARDGEITVVDDTPATFSWQANRLPGAWVMRRAIEAVVQRLQDHPVVTATIANSSHLGCLQVYLPALTGRNLMVILSATNPGLESVAPFGGIDPVLTTNPIAFGIPTRGTPMLIDLSTSLVTNAAVAGHLEAGTRFESDCLLDNQGNPSADPAVFVTDPPGTILPLGGSEYGYKGFGLGLLVEALSLALPGAGRALRPDKFSQGAFLQVIDPGRFGGLDYFLRETSELADRCRASRVPAGRPPVRLPGERAMNERERRLREGVPISARVRDKLAGYGSSAGLEFPARLDRRRQS
jgi:LDH2 family malate/lactate/ureidoglycolate dehydrogenase